jgi:DNA-directed RNA polymerase beta' subunit
MSDLMKLIQEADVASVEFEKARAHVDAAKLSLETAKDQQEQARVALDEIVNRADEFGVPRAKVKKLIEERTQMLMASGLIPTTAEIRASAGVRPRMAKKVKIVSDTAEKEDFVPNIETDDTPGLELAN